jgi:hypothetical protein
MDDKEMIAFQDARIFALLRDIERATEREANLIELVDELEREVKRLRSVIALAALREDGPTKSATEVIARLRAKHAAHPEAPTRAFHVLAGMPEDSDPRGGCGRLPVSAAAGDVTRGSDPSPSGDLLNRLERTEAERGCGADLQPNEEKGLGTLLHAIGREAVPTDAEAESFEQLRNKTPAVPPKPGS